jgi:hypothetical protein
VRSEVKLVEGSVVEKPYSYWLELFGSCTGESQGLRLVYSQ